MQAPVLPRIPRPNWDDDSGTRGVMLSTLSVINVTLVSLLTLVRLFTIVSDGCSFSSLTYGELDYLSPPSPIPLLETFVLLLVTFIPILVPRDRGSHLPSRCYYSASQKKPDPLGLYFCSFEATYLSLSMYVSPRNVGIKTL